MYPLIHDSWSQKEIESINRVIKSNRFSMGPHVADFEKKFAKKFRVKYAICVNSGSSANLIAIAALRFLKKAIMPGDEIIVPAIGWSTTYSPLFYLGFKPVFVDINAKSLNIDVDLIESQISKKTKAILVVNLLGKSAEYKKIKLLCQKYNLHLIEDNCESMGAKYKSQFNGTLGLAGTFSFFYSHHITTVEGGMITTNDRQFYDICISLRAHGWLRNLDESSHLYDKNVDDFRRMFWFVLPGFNVRPIEFTGAIGIEQLKKFDSMLKIRRTNHKLFIKLFENNKYLYVQDYEKNHSSFSFALILRKNNNNLRNNLVEYLKKKGIETRPIASGNITRNPFIKYFNLSKKPNCKNANFVDTNGFMVGNHPIDLTSNLKLLKQYIDNFFEKIEKV